MIVIDRILRARKKPLGCIVTLPGRGGTGRGMVDIYKQTELDKSLIIGITPSEKQWYPLPNGVEDQQAAVAGLDNAIENISGTLKRIRRSFGVVSRNTVLAGFSAGAVVALQIAALSEFPFAAVICHSGAILEPNKLPQCKHPSTKIMLVHSQDDTCFFWDERYLPMKKALQEKGYDFVSLERRVGNHGIYRPEIVMAGTFLAPILGYPKNWTHSEAKF